MLVILDDLFLGKSIDAVDVEGVGTANHDSYWSLECKGLVDSYKLVLADAAHTIIQLFLLDVLAEVSDAKHLRIVREVTVHTVALCLLPQSQLGTSDDLLGNNLIGNLNKFLFIFNCLHFIIEDEADRPNAQVQLFHQSHWRD